MTGVVPLRRRLRLPRESTVDLEKLSGGSQSTSLTLRHLVVVHQVQEDIELDLGSIIRYKWEASAFLWAESF